MDGVAPKPEHRPLGSRVDAVPLPLCLVEALERPGEHLGRHLELTACVGGFLGAIAREARPLVAVHRGEARALLHNSEVQVLPQDEKNVANMARILEC